ncbi:MAG: hypothetical protein ACREFZ_02640, partial [Acetobacteraceae bacterium]
MLDRLNDGRPVVVFLHSQRGINHRMKRLSLPHLATPVTLLVALSLLSACASHGPRINAREQAARYAARAPRDYRPPGPAWNPWGPYIEQAAHRFDIPPAWT